MSRKTKLSKKQIKTALSAIEFLSDSDFEKQMKRLDPPGGYNIRRAIDFYSRGLISRPVGKRGKGVKRQWLPWTPSEFDASARTATHITLPSTAEVRRLSLILWSCGDFRDVLRRASEFRDKQAFEIYIPYWLANFCGNLRVFYEDRFRKDRLDYFESEGFKVVVRGLTHGFYEGYTVDAAGNLVRPQPAPGLDPEQVIKNFPSGGAEDLSSSMSLAARPRE